MSAPPEEEIVQLPRPTLAPNGLVGVLVPWGNTTAQLEIASLTPSGVIDAVGRFNFGPGVDLDAELRAVAEKLMFAEATAMSLSLSPEMFAGGLDRARSYQAAIADASGVPTSTSTEGTFHRLRRLGASRIGLIAPAPPEQMEHATANFATVGFTVVRSCGMDCGLPNIKATPLDDIAEAFRRVDHPDVEAFVQTGTGLPAFSVADLIAAELGRPVITSTAAGYLQTLESLELNPEDAL